MTNRRLRRVLSALPLALVISLSAAPAHASWYATTPHVFSAPTAHAAGASCAAANSSPADAGPAQLEEAVLCLVNRERTARGLSRLQSEDHLDRAARGHSKAMVQQRFFDHVSPGGASVVVRAKRKGYRPAYGNFVGENIAWGSGIYATPAEIVDGWMHSSGHRANILHRQYHDIGVGVALGSPRGSVGQPAATYTTDFGSRR
ncbi:MAG TPA: CAP domain-containing protein [Solirubrobacteraceae bacterium]|jgi:uncharacterized protein YkwD